MKNYDEMSEAEKAIWNCDFSKIMDLLTKEQHCPLLPGNRLPKGLSTLLAIKRQMKLEKEKEVE